LAWVSGQEDKLTKFRTHIIFLAVFSIMLTGCFSKTAERIAEHGGKKLSAAEIQSVVSGNTLHFQEEDSTATIEMYENGTLRAWIDPLDKNQGRWSTDDKDRLCIRFKYRKWGSGGEQCYNVYQFDDEYRQYTSGGILASTFTVDPGTSEGPPSHAAASTEKGRKSETAPPAATTAEPRRQIITKSAPPVQEEPSAQPSFGPNAQKDLRLIYRQMSKNCPGCNLANIDLHDADLAGANLAGANLTGSNLSKVNLKLANLKGATLVRTNLTGANLAGADLAGADLTGADLTGANLVRANLRGADLTRVVGADLSGAIR